MIHGLACYARQGVAIHLAWAVDSESMRARGISVLVKSN